MSLIRCLSNPEALYIWGDADGFYSLVHCVKPPLASKWPKDCTPMIRIPVGVFEKACLEWKDGGGWVDEKIEVDGFIIEMVHVVRKTGKKPPKLTLKNMFKGPHGDFLIRLSYKRQFVHLWDVTWTYVVNNVEDRRKPVRRRAKTTC
jgi:hypothetical protein